MSEENKIPFEEWKAMKRAECNSLMEEQEKALKQVCASGASLFSFLTGCGRMKSRVSAGNAALILQAFPDARAIKTLQHWNQFGRRINKGAKSMKVLFQKDGHWETERVFELSQTNGNRQYPQIDLEHNQALAHSTVEAMLQLSQVPVEKENVTSQVEYDRENKKIKVDPTSRDIQILRKLPAVLIESYLMEQAAITSPKVIALYGTAVSVEVCSRFGISVDEHTEQILSENLAEIGEGLERETLDDIGSFVRTIGDHAYRSLPSRNAPVYTESSAQVRE